MSNIKPVGKLFPNLTKRIASYDPATQITIFEEISNERRSGLFNGSPKPGDEHDLSVIAHEYRHCLDHLSTLWGQKHLLKLQKAINAVFNDNTALDNDLIINDILEYKSEENRSFQQNISDPALQAAATFAEQSNRFWIGIKVSEAQNSIERVNKGNLILKAEFYTLKEKYVYVSLPLNVITLLEINALAEEEKTLIHCYSSWHQRDDLAFHYYANSPDRNRQTLNYELAVYNVAVQVARSILDMSSWTESVIVASYIATLALNLPEYLIKILPVDNCLGGNFTKEQAQQLLNDGDYGFVFYALCKNFKVRFKRGEFEKFSLEDLLESNKLPNSTQLISIVKNEFMSIAEENKKYKFSKRFMNYNLMGGQILVQYGLDGGFWGVFHKFYSVKWSPAYAVIDGGIDYGKNWKYSIIEEESNLKNANFWYSIVKDADDIMNVVYNEFLEKSK